MNRLALWWSALVIAGCGPTVEGLCEDLADECSANEAYVIEPQECTAGGERLETSADDNDCDDAFYTYLECVDEQRCAWITACAMKRADFDKCVNEAD